MFQYSAILSDLRQKLERAEKITHRLTEMGPAMSYTHDEITIEIPPEHREEANKLIAELNALGDRPMIPTVGRIVHYTNLGDADGKYPPEQQAALITKVQKRTEVDITAPIDEEKQYLVSLHIFYETGDFYMKNVPYSAEYKRGHWTWQPWA